MKKAVHNFRQRLGLTIMPRCCRDEVYANERVAAAVELENTARERMAEAKRLGRKYAQAWQREDVAVMDQVEATARDQGIIFERKDNRK